MTDFHREANTMAGGSTGNNLSLVGVEVVSTKLENHPEAWHH
jgi:hypothetical protein